MEGAANTDDLIMKLSLYTNEKLLPGETYIFFDEIQRYKEIVTKIKFLAEDNKYRYVLSGSLLGVEIIGLSSAPVGYLRELEMFPMDFEKFLQIYNIQDDLIDNLKRHFDELTSVDEVIHERMLDIFNQYLLIGGMPSAVAKFQETRNIDDAIAEHNDIMSMYRLDFTQYEEKSSLFKLFISDIGLLTTMYGKSTKLKIVQRDAAVNNGSVFENNIHYLPIYMIMFISDNNISFPEFDLKF